MNRSPDLCTSVAVKKPPFGSVMTALRFPLPGAARAFAVPEGKIGPFVAIWMEGHGQRVAHRPAAEIHSILLVRDNVIGLRRRRDHAKRDGSQGGGNGCGEEAYSVHQITLL